MSRRAALLAAASHATAGGPPPPEPLFFDGFESGDFVKWNSLQWKNRNGSGDEYSGAGEYSAQVVAVDGRPHVARFELRNGDTPPFGGGERTEIGEPIPAVVCEVDIGDERWITWDMKFDSTWPIMTSWCVIWQWHHNAGDGSPPFTLLCEDDNIILSNDDEVIETVVQTVQRNVWQRWVVHVLFHDNPSIGYADVWVDGVKLIDHELRPTMIAGDSGAYFKTGVYRDASHTSTAITYRDNLAIWDVEPPELS